MKGADPLVTHYVYDMTRALTFYKAVFDVDEVFTSPGWSSLDFGAIQLALIILHDDNKEAPIPHAGLLVDNIEAMQAGVEAYGGKLTELREPDGFVPVRVASFVDCVGNGFDLRQELD